MNPYTELITRYINGELSASDKAAFEAQLSSNAELKKEYELQLKLVESVKRMGLKNQLASSFKKVKTTKLISKALIGLAITLAVLGAVILIKNQSDKAPDEIRYELNEEGKANWSEADKTLESQLFRINPDRDTIIETQQGIVIAIPAASFEHKTGGGITGPFDLEVKEAMTASEIMKAGLSTLSNDKPLETGGMFYINARQGNENLLVNRSKPLNVNVPVNNDKNDMMLFKGERRTDGSINWVEPKPMKRKLTTVDILKLDFYPEHFLDSLKSMGFNIKNKKLTDSMYYSFSGYCDIKDVEKYTDPVMDSVVMETRTDMPVVSGQYQLTVGTSISRNVAYAATKTNTTAAPFDKGTCEIDPSRIKAIWNKRFNHTILATKEFEERLKVIFKTCDSRVFNLYVNNLDKNLYEIDSMAAGLLSGELKSKFMGFYSLKDGGVDISDAQSKQLQVYFEEKRSVYTKAVTATLQKMYDEEGQKNQMAFKEYVKHQTNEIIRNSTTFNEEFNLNLDEAYRQLGISRGRATTTHSYTVYSGPYTYNYISAPVIQTGWCNVDRYTLNATTNRSTLNFKDSFSGKTANISYKPVSVSVENYVSYDRVVCYMIPDKLSSFQTLAYSGNRFTEKLNELIGYSIVTIGFKGEQCFYNEVKQAQAQQYTVSLKSIHSKALDKFLNSSFPLNKVSDLTKDIDYQVFDYKETIRTTKIVKREIVRSCLLPVVLPCAVVPIERETDGIY